MESVIKFSITIPAYKQTYLKECIDSCLAQTYTNFELIIVNDASPEDLDSIVGKYNDKRIRYYKNKKNYGAVNVVENWNKCLEYATGEYIICMGDDDMLLPCCLEEYVKLMKLYPGLGVYHAWTEIIDEQSHVSGIQNPRPEYESALSLVYFRWNGRKMQFIGDFCYSVDLLRRSGGFYHLPMAWGSDDITAIIAAEKGIANTQKICFRYRINSQTITKTGGWNVKIDATLLEEQWYQSFLSNCRKNRLSELDNKFLELLLLQKNNHFKNKYKWELLEGGISGFSRFVYYLRKHNQLHLSKLDILLIWLKSMLRNK